MLLTPLCLKVLCCCLSVTRRLGHSSECRLEAELQIPVVHQEEGIDQFESLVADVDLVGLSPENECIHGQQESIQDDGDVLYHLSHVILQVHHYRGHPFRGDLAHHVVVDVEH